MTPTPKEVLEQQLQILGHTQATLHSVGEVHAEHVALLQAMQEPPMLTTYTLSVTTPTRRVTPHNDAPALSVGIINPSAFVVRLGLAGSATAAARAVPVPAVAAMVIPVAVREFEIGLDDPTILAGATVVVYVLRWRTVQPFFLNRG
jgi:hypothetical protein